MTTLTQAAKKMLASIEQQKEVFGSYGGGTLREYLWTVAAGATTFEAIGEGTGLTKSQVSRVARTLHKLNYTGDDGLDLIDITFDLHNPRVKLVSLNDKGVKMLTKEWKTITGETIK